MCVESGSRLIDIWSRLGSLRTNTNKVSDMVAVANKGQVSGKHCQIESHVEACNDNMFMS